MTLLTGRSAARSRQYLISLNFSSASAEGFLSGWYYEVLSMRTNSRGKPTDFHCLLSIGLLKLCIVGINCDTELCSIDVNQIIRVYTL